MALGALIFLVPSALRLTDVGFKNDQFYQISAAREILRGGLPYRDFYDQGLGVQLFLSAGAMAATGGTLLGEALLGVLLLSLATLYGYLLARQASGSTLVGLAASALIVAGTLRSFQHYKLLVPLVVLGIMWRYAETRSRRDLAILGLATAVGGLMRYDLAVYVSAGVIIFLAWLHFHDGLLAMMRRGALWGAWVLLGLLPWLAYIQASGGVVGYAQELISISLRLSRQEPFFQILHNRPPFGIDLSLPMVTIEPPTPAPRAGVNIRWARSTSDETRARLVERYSLEEAAKIADRSWKYFAADTSRGTLEAIVTDPAVEDTYGVDRRWYFLTEPPREPPLESWRRAVPLLRMSLLPGVFTVQNGTAWLFYLFHAMPVVAVGVLVSQRCAKSQREIGAFASTGKVVAVVALSAVATPILVRPTLELRLLDAVGLAAVLGAWLVGQGLGLRVYGADSPKLAAARGSRSAWRLWTLARISVVLLLIALTWISLTRITDFGRHLEQSGFYEGPAAVAERITRVTRGLHTSPPLEAWAPEGVEGGRALARYVNECTASTDRLLVLAYQPQFYYYTDRGLGTRYLIVRAGWWASDDDQRRAVDMLQARSVPIVLWDQKSYGEVEENFRILTRFLEERYFLVREDGFGDDSGFTWRVLVNREAVPVCAHPGLGLPCFVRGTAATAHDAAIQDSVLADSVPVLRLPG